MTLENVIPFLSKKPREAKNMQQATLNIDPNADDARARRNRLAALCRDSNMIKKAA